MPLKKNGFGPSDFRAMAMSLNGFSIPSILQGTPILSESVPIIKNGMGELDKCNGSANFLGMPIFL